MMLCESISEIGLMIQGHLQGQMSWSTSCKFAQVLWQMSLKSAVVGITKPNCWLFGPSLNDVVWISFSNGVYEPRSSSKLKIVVKVQYTLSGSKGQAGELDGSSRERFEIAQPTLQWRNLCRMASARDYAVPSAKYAWFYWWTQKYELHLW